MRRRISSGHKEKRRFIHLTFHQAKNESERDMELIKDEAYGYDERANNKHRTT